MIDEGGNPVENARVSVGFIPMNGGNDVSKHGQTDISGMYSSQKKSIESIVFNIEKDGYYYSRGGYRFDKSSFGKWQPWNPEIQVILRKIIKPVPMYARDTNMSKMEIPVDGKSLGFDLIEYDWVAPYGHGKHPDFIFEVHRNYMKEDDYKCSLGLSFANKFDGIQIVDNAYKHSLFKLPRFAPESNYIQALTKHVSYDPQKGSQSDFNKGAYYIFRVRSEVKNGKLVRAMYGKIHGDIEFYPTPKPNKFANFQFKYYLNPGYTNNLEFDPKQNLFKNMQSYEGLTRP